MSTNPYIIIVAGPTASGKGDTPRKVQDLLKLSTRPPKEVIIDDLVEANPYYRRQVSEFIETKKKEGLQVSEIVNLFANPTEEHIKKFSDLYFYSRKNTNCHSGEPIQTTCASAASACKPNCDNRNDKILDDAFKNSDNIVFETTGVWWPEWVFTIYGSYMKAAKYDVIMAYSIVELCELLSRNKTRAVNTVENFLIDSTSSPPRLPDIRIVPYKENLEKIISTFKSHNSECLPDQEELCIRFLILDNNTRGTVLLYDSFSQSSEIGDQAIDQYGVTSSSNCSKKGGGKRRSTKRKKSIKKNKKRKSKKGKSKKRKSKKRKRKSKTTRR